jgi:hypothetical protein
MDIMVQSCCHCRCNAESLLVQDVASTHLADRHRQNTVALIINVFTDQVHAAWGTKGTSVED